jgi:hypothetical protein
VGDVPSPSELVLIEGAGLVGDGLRGSAVLHVVLLVWLRLQRARDTLCI